MRHTKRVIIFVPSLFSLVAPILCYGQVVIVGPKSAKYEDVTITIGMTKAKVLETFDASSTVVLTKASEVSYGVYQKGLIYLTQPLGSIHFERELVKALAVNEADPAVGREAHTLFNNIYTSIQKLKSKQCRIDTFVDPDPNTKIFKVILHCGAETMQVTAMTLEEQAETTATVRVSRVIQ